MVNGRAPLYLTLVAAALFAGAVLFFQPYSADSSGEGFAKPARRYIRAAMRQDSAALRRLSLSLNPVVWTLRAARNHPESLAAWSGKVEALAAERSGDTTQVLVYGGDDRCSHSPIVLRFVGSAERAKVARVESRCLDPDTSHLAR